MAQAAVPERLAYVFLGEKNQILVDADAELLMPLLTCEDARTRLDALWLTSKLSQNDEAREIIRSKGGLEMLLESGTSKSTEEKHLALRALCQMSLDDSNKSEIRELGGIQSILLCLRSDEHDIETARLAIRVLCNLSTQEENKSRIRADGGLATILPFMFVDDVKTLRDVLRLFCNLAVDSENRRQLRELDLAGRLLQSVGNLRSDDWETRKYAMAVLLNMCSSSSMSSLASSASASASSSGGISVEESCIRDVVRGGGLTLIAMCIDCLQLEVVRVAIRLLCCLCSSSAECRASLSSSGGLQRVLNVAISSAADDVHLLGIRIIYSYLTNQEPLPWQAVDGAIQLCGPLARLPSVQQGGFAATLLSECMLLLSSNPEYRRTLANKTHLLPPPFDKLASDDEGVRSAAVEETRRKLQAQRIQQQQQQQQQSGQQNHVLPPPSPIFRNPRPVSSSARDLHRLRQQAVIKDDEVRRLKKQLSESQASFGAYSDDAAMEKMRENMQQLQRVLRSKETEVVEAERIIRQLREELSKQTVHMDHELMVHKIKAREAELALAESRKLSASLSNLREDSSLRPSSAAYAAEEARDGFNSAAQRVVELETELNKQSAQFKAEVARLREELAETRSKLASSTQRFRGNSNNGGDSPSKQRLNAFSGAASAIPDDMQSTFGAMSVAGGNRDGSVQTFSRPFGISSRLVEGMEADNTASFNSGSAHRSMSSVSFASMPPAPQQQSQYQQQQAPPQSAQSVSSSISPRNRPGAPVPPGSSAASFARPSVSSNSRSSPSQESFALPPSASVSLKGSGAPMRPVGPPSPPMENSAAASPRRLGQSFGFGSEPAQRTTPRLPPDNLFDSTPAGSNPAAELATPQGATPRGSSNKYEVQTIQPLSPSDVTVLVHRIATAATLSGAAASDDESVEVLASAAEALRLLQERATSMADVRITLRHIEAIRPVVEFLRHSTSIQSRRTCLKLLSLLIVDENGLVVENRDQRTVEAIVDILLMPEVDDVDRAYAVSLLKQLAVYEENASDMIRCNILPTLVKLTAAPAATAAGAGVASAEPLSPNVQQADIRRDAVKTLRNIAAFPGPVHTAIRKEKGIQPLIDALSSTDADLARASSKSLMYLSVNPENRSEIRTLAGLKPIIALLTCGDEDTQRSAAGALINLSVNSRNKTEIKTAGGIAPLMECLASHDLELQRYCIRTISNLALNDECKSEILARRGVTTLLGCLRCEDSSHILQRFGCRSLGLICTGQPEAIDLFLTACGLEEINHLLPSSRGGSSSSSSHFDDETISEILSVVFCIVSGSEAQRRAVSAIPSLVASILRALSRSMSPLSSSPSTPTDAARQVRRQSLLILQHIVVDHEARAALAQDTSVLRLALDACTCIDSADLMRAAALILGQMSGEEQCKHEARRQGLASRLVECMRSTCPVSSPSASSSSSVAATRRPSAGAGATPLNASGSPVDFEFVDNCLLSVFHLSTLDVNRTEFRLAHGLPIFIELLHNVPTTTLRAALKALYALSVDDVNEVEICQLGGLTHLLECLRNTDVQVRRRAIGVVCNVSVNDGNKAEFKRIGALPAIAELVKTNGAGDEKTKADAIKAVRNLAYDDESRRIFGHVGAVPPIVDSLPGAVALGALGLPKPVADPVTVRVAIRALCVLSIDAENRNAIFTRQGIKPIVQCVSAEDIETRRAAVGTLVNMSIHKTHKGQVRTFGGIKSLSACLASTDAETCRFALRALANMTMAEEMVEDVVEVECVPLLLRCLLPHSAVEQADLDTVNGSLCVLQNLANTVEGKRALRNIGAPAQVISCLRTLFARSKTAQPSVEQSALLFSNILLALRVLTALMGAYGTKGAETIIASLKSESSIPLFMDILRCDVSASASSASDREIRCEVLKLLQALAYNSKQEISEGGGITVLLNNQIMAERLDDANFKKAVQSALNILQTDANMKREVARAREGLGIGLNAKA